MADDDGNSDDNVFSTKKRFEIYVPEPKARINFGAPSEDKENGPFGYTGLSLQSDVHMFIDANKDLQLQATNLQAQAGGKWMQYASEEMFLSSTASTNLSADKRVLIASGAGQGSIGALDHGKAPRLVPYNSLPLHYRVDRLQVGLFEFFHGRRAREKYSPTVVSILAAGGVDSDYFDGESALETQAEGQLNGGFTVMAANSLRELYPVASERAVTEHGEDPTEIGDPIVLLDPFFERKVFGSSDEAKSLTYGFSRYLSRFDPYAKSDPSKITNPIGRGFVKLRNMLATLRRFADVASKYASLLSDNFLAKRAQAAMGAVDNLAKSVWKAYTVVDLTFGTFGGTGGMGAGFEDERASGWDARRKTVTDNRRQDARDQARDSIWDKHKATVASNEGPFDLSRMLPEQWLLHIETDTPRERHFVKLGGASPEPAVLDVTASLASIPPWLRVKVFRPNSLPDQVPMSALLEHAATCLGPLEPLDEATATGGGHVVPIALSTAQNLVSYPVDTTDPRSVRLTPFTYRRQGRTHTCTLRDFTTLTLVERTAAVELSVAGNPVTVRLTRPSSGFASADDEQAYVRGAFAAAISGFASVGAAGETFTITTTSTGSLTEIRVLQGLESLGLRDGQTERGRDGRWGIYGLDLRKITPEKIVELIGEGNGFTALVEEGKVRITAKNGPRPGADSAVRLSGTLATTIFASEQIKVEKASTYQSETDRAATDRDLKTLLVWNNELQKLPEDTRNLTRPITSSIHATVAAFSHLEKSLESVADFVGGDLKGLPDPPEAIGLIADEGITLGTRDRIVGAGGKGIVFIVDGGSGNEDHQKFIPGAEAFVNLSLAWDPLDKLLGEATERWGWKKDEAKRVPSVGFRVLADPSVDLFGTFGAEVLALGRGKVQVALKDGKEFVGVGIARLAGSYAAEVAAYRKVVISARNAGKDDKDGGRVELAAQTVAIGAMNVANDVKDFKIKGGIGIEPLGVNAFAGVEHLPAEAVGALRTQLAAYAWPETLRKGGDAGHPNTQQVIVHAAKETIIQVGTFLVHVDAEKGVTVATRKPDPSALANEPDPDKPSFSIDGTKIVATSKAGAEGVKLELTGKTMTITAADKTSLVVSNDGVKGTGGKQFYMQGDDVKIDGTKTYTVSGTEMKYKFSGTFKIG